MHSLLERYAVKTLISPATSLTASANGTGVDLGVGYNGHIAVVLFIASASGSAITGDFVIEGSDDDSTYTAIPGATFTQVDENDAGKLAGVEFKTSYRYIRIAATLGGGSPFFVVGAWAYAEVDVASSSLISATAT